MKNGHPFSLGLFLIALTVFGSTPDSSAQVYSVTVCDRLLYKVDHSWLIGTPNNGYGLFLYRDRNVDGVLIRRTRICLGLRNVTVPTGVVTFGAVGGAGLLALAGLLILERRLPNQPVEATADPLSS